MCWFDMYKFCYAMTRLLLWTFVVVGDMFLIGEKEAFFLFDKDER